MTLGERIAKLRNDAGYSQEYIAEQLDVSRQAVSKWEKDLSSPDTENLIKLAEVLNTSVQFLATGKDFYFPEAKPAPEKKKINKKRIAVIVSILLLVPVCLYVFIGIFSSVDYDANRYDETAYDMRYEQYLAYKYSDELAQLFLEESNNEFFESAGVNAYSYRTEYGERKIILNTEVYITTTVGNKLERSAKFEGTRIWYNTYIWRIVSIDG